MAIVEGFSDSSVALLLVVLAALLWMVKLAYDLKHSIIQRSKMLDSKVSSLEGRAVSIRREMIDLHKAVGQKLDKEEFEKRIDGLIELVGKKEKAERKRDAR
ncbi:MAG: hypothetical protein ABIG96_04880 [Candidatus Micrarchaeota archaeon]